MSISIRMRFSTPGMGIAADIPAELEMDMETTITGQ